MKKSVASFRLIVLIAESLIFSITVSAESNEECKGVGQTSSTVRLKNYLFCNYPWNENDTKTNSTLVGIELLPKFATMNEYDNYLELSTWIHVTWIDEHLAWDPAQFDDLRHLDVRTPDIWAPAIAFQSLDTEELDDDILILGKRCSVNCEGKISCVSRQRVTINCENDSTLWPYDRQNCTLVLTSWAHMRNQIVFAPVNISNQTVFTYDFVINGHWEIFVSRIAYEQTRSKHLPTLKSSQFSVDFIVDRIHPQLAARYVMPGILITIMTLTTVKLDPGSKERLALGCLNPIVHLLSIEDLNCILPQNMNGVPNIVLIYVNSFGLAIVALLLTIFLANLRKSKNSVPKWISSAFSSVLRHKIGQIILLNNSDRSADSNDAEHTYDLVNFEHEKTHWNYVVALFNWITFLGFLFIYVLLWIILAPNPSMKTPVVDVSQRF